MTTGLTCNLAWELFVSFPVVQEWDSDASLFFFFFFFFSESGWLARGLVQNTGYGIGEQGAVSHTLNASRAIVRKSFWLG